MEKTIFNEIKILAENYATELKSQVDLRVEAMKSDDTSKNEGGYGHT